MKTAAIAMLAAMLFTVPNVEADACMHPPQDAKGVKVEQSEQSALLVHNNGQQELIIRPAVVAEGALTGLAWVIPVPSVPDRYAVADTELFAAVDELAGLVKVVNPPALRSKSKSAAPAGPAASPLVVLPVAKAGPYEIHPLQATGAEGAKQLNAWMTKNGFGELAKDELEHYSSRGWTFLAVKVGAPEGGSLSDGRLPPLHLSFASKRIVYPLKLSANQGQFDLRLFIVTRTQPEGLEEAIAKFKFNRVVYEPALGELGSPTVPPDTYPDGTILKATEQFDTASVGAALKAVLEGAKLTGKLRLEVVNGVVNTPDTDVNKWPEDFSIAVAEGDTDAAGAKVDEPKAADPVAPAVADKPKSSGCASTKGEKSTLSPLFLLLGLFWRRRRT